MCAADLRGGTGGLEQTIANVIYISKESILVLLSPNNQFLAIWVISIIVISPIKSQYQP